MQATRVSIVNVLSLVNALSLYQTLPQRKHGILAALRRTVRRPEQMPGELNEHFRIMVNALDDIVVCAIAAWECLQEYISCSIVVA